jgi:hypothetical protein
MFGQEMQGGVTLFEGKTIQPIAAGIPRELGELDLGKLT